jgi:hypothetical protein
MIEFLVSLFILLILGDRPDGRRKKKEDDCYFFLEEWDKERK